VIVVDTSALLAVVLKERSATACMRVLENEDDIPISAGTLAESLIVAGRRKVAHVMFALIDEISCQVVPVTRADAVAAAAAYARRGKGVHPAGLTYGGCFAYALAAQHGCKLLFVGGDFGRTDIGRCLPG
jgi:ribonuclease VapC